MEVTSQEFDGLIVLLLLEDLTHSIAEDNGNN